MESPIGHADEKPFGFAWSIRLRAYAGNRVPYKPCDRWHIRLMRDNGTRYARRKPRLRQAPPPDSAAASNTATKQLNADFNPDVDGFESFVMNDGTTCA